MSRYGFTPKVPSHGIAAASLKGLTIVVGWDNPLQTFFGDVEDENGDQIMSTMLMMNKHDIQSVDALGTLVGYDIPTDIKAKLESDRENRTEPTPHQKRIASLFK